ncbi:hypothetical protein NQ318_009070 [Aromia moschata]|uniref:Uncharacterized protein n=1 Tax=Aromia moschata TaxID=1265417 RepID=A0AAV8YU68_9CUCU|nr:hypothetical protein NQ318_009070 [Aromia moschata]
MVPKLLTPEQKESRINICASIINITDTVPGFYDLETKLQSIHWKSPNSPRQKKARMSQSKFAKQRE